MSHTGQDGREQFDHGEVVGIRDLMRYVWGWGDPECAAAAQYYEDLHSIRNYHTAEGITVVDGYVAEGVDAFRTVSNRQEVTGVTAIHLDCWRVDDPARLREFAEDLRRHFVQHGERGYRRVFGGG